MRWIALDTETALANNREPVPRLVSVAIANDEGEGLYAAHEPRLLEILRAVWSGGVVLANGPFDAFVLARAFPELWPMIVQAWLESRAWDVLTGEKLVDIADGFYRRRGGYNLGAVAARRAGMALNKHDPWRKRYATLLGLEIAQWPVDARTYALDDVRATWRTFTMHQAERARHRADVFADLPNQCRAALALYDQTLSGMHTDPARVEALDRELARKIAHLESRVLACGLARADGKVWDEWLAKPWRDGRTQPKKITLYKEAAQRMLAELPGARLTINPPSPTAIAKGITTGTISLSDDALEEVGIPRGRWGDPKRRPGEDPFVLYDKGQSPPLREDGTGDPATVLAHPLECFRTMSMRSGRTKNIPILRHPVIRTRFDELVGTGRTSASGFKIKKSAADDAADEDAEDEIEQDLDEDDPWVGTNTQNWDHSVGYRECIVPPPPDEFSGPDGYMLAITDFGALELVTRAQFQLDVHRRSALAEVLRAGLCPHSSFGADLLGIDYKSFDKAIPLHFDHRQLGKAWNFGKAGLMGQDRFIRWAWSAYEIRVSPDDERRYTDAWHRKFPEERMTWEWIKRYCQSGVDDKRKPLYTIMLPRSRRIRGRLYLPEAANTTFQGPGADVAKLALWYLFVARYTPSSPLYRCRQIIFAHDENVTAIPRRMIREAGTDKKGNPILVSPALDEQERLMVAASAYWCPDVPMKVESKFVDRYCK